MTRHRTAEPGTIYRCSETGMMLEVDANGEAQPFEPASYDPDLDAPPPIASAPDVGRRRTDLSVSAHRTLTLDEMERAGEPTFRRPRHDGWTPDKQRHFIETLAATASISEAARFVGMTRQSAHRLYRRDAKFRAAWDEAMRAAVGVLAATAFDRAVNGTEEQIWYKGEMVGVREKHHDRLLIYLLRVRDPLNYAPLDDLAGWQRHRAVEAAGDGLDRALEQIDPQAPTAPALPAQNSAPAALPAPEPTPTPADPLAAALDRLAEPDDTAPEPPLTL